LLVYSTRCSASDVRNYCPPAWFVQDDEVS
jgi:hypothetical protein